MKSVPITTKVVSSNPAHGEVYFDTTFCDEVCRSLAAGRWFSPGTQFSSIDKTDRQDIAQILLKVALNTITLTLILDLTWYIWLDDKQLEINQSIVFNIYKLIS